MIFLFPRHTRETDVEGWVPTTPHPLTVSDTDTRRPGVRGLSESKGESVVVRVAPHNERTTTCVEGVVNFRREGRKLIREPQPSSDRGPGFRVELRQG